MSEHKKPKKQAHHQQAEVLESGRIYYFYRPKVSLEHAESYDDVQKLYFLLDVSADKHDPRKTSDKTTKRLFIMTKKRMPLIGIGRDVHWAFTTVVSNSLEDIHKELDMYEYDTKTRGHRTVAAARVAGEGVYELIKHDRGTTLATVLELPEALGPVQKALGIAKEACYIVQAKNPTITTTSRGEPSIGLKPSAKAHFPKEVQDMFKGVRVEQRRFAPITFTKVLDFPHMEMLLVAESGDIVYEFGELGEKLEKQEEADLEQARKDLKGHVEDKPLKELHMSDKEEHSVQPLKTGEFS